jgi:murein L,D-transpeptidase YcbB/YkuD
MLRQALGIPANDNFDADADVAVRKFQTSHGLTVDGVVGTMTRHALGLAACSELR